jgi:hypothetical protein
MHDTHPARENLQTLPQTYHQHVHKAARRYVLPQSDGSLAIVRSNSDRALRVPKRDMNLAVTRVTDVCTRLVVGNLGTSYNPEREWEKNKIYRSESIQEGFHHFGTIRTTTHDNNSLVAATDSRVRGL